MTTIEKISQQTGNLPEVYQTEVLDLGIWGIWCQAPGKLRSFILKRISKKIVKKFKRN